MTDEKQELEQALEGNAPEGEDQVVPEKTAEAVAEEPVATVEPESPIAAPEDTSSETAEATAEEPGAAVEPESPIAAPEDTSSETAEATAEEPVAAVEPEVPIAAPEDTSSEAVEVTAEEPKAAEEPADKMEEPKVEKLSEEGKSHVDYSRTFKGLSRGDLVDGVVVHIDKEGVLVDVGTKSEGIIRPGELSAGHVESPEDVVSVGETIRVYVMQSEDGEGNLILSKKRADFEKAWDRVQQAFEEGKVITAMVSDRVKGGLQVDLGIRGFVPGSHVGSGKVMNLDRYVGQSLPLKVIEIDRERRKVVLSHRLATEEQRSKQRETTVSSLAEGQIRDGIVRRITDYGAFVDLGGVDGLLHISEMSWTRITHPSDMVKVGQKITVMILKLDPRNERISLGLRQILPDPWAGIEGRYRVGDIIHGKVTRMVPFGAFVQLDEGIEAIIPNTELSHKRVKRPDDVVAVGQDVEVKVIDVRPEERRMTLSLRQLQDKEPHQGRASEGYQSSGFSGRMTLGDLVGDKLQGLVSARASEEERIPEEKEIEEPAPKPKAKSTRKRTLKKAAKEEADDALVEIEPEPEPAEEPAIVEAEPEAAEAPPEAESASEAEPDKEAS